MSFEMDRVTNAHFNFYHGMETKGDSKQKYNSNINKVVRIRLLI